MTSLSGEDRLIYICSAFFVRIKCLWFTWNASIFKFHYTGEEPPHTTPHHFKKSNFIFKMAGFCIANQCTPRLHKNKHWRKWASFEAYWYALQYKAMSTNFLQPRPECVLTPQLLDKNHSWPDKAELVDMTGNWKRRELPHLHNSTFTRSHPQQPFVMKLHRHT